MFPDFSALLHMLSSLLTLLQIFIYICLVRMLRRAS
jgi:hypothetical protein